MRLPECTANVVNGVRPRVLPKRDRRTTFFENRMSKGPGMADAADKNVFSMSSLAMLSAAYQRKILQITQTNTQAAFDYAASLGRCRSADEFVALTQDYTRRQIENFQRQGGELMQLVQEGEERVAAPPVQPK